MAAYSLTPEEQKNNIKTEGLFPYASFGTRNITLKLGKTKVRIITRKKKQRRREINFANYVCKMSHLSKNTDAYTLKGWQPYGSQSSMTPAVRVFIHRCLENKFCC